VPVPLLLGSWILLSVVAAAQSTLLDAEINRARQLLYSASLPEKAWGAHLAAGLDDNGLRDKLIDELRAATKFSDAEPFSSEHAYVQTLLDSLIQLKAVVPLDLIKPFESQWRAEFFILLSRAPKTESVLLAMREQKLYEIEWLLVNNLLLRMRSRPFFERILGEISITHQFKMVGHPGTARQAGIPTWSADGIGNPNNNVVRHFPSEFPPIGVYRLMYNPERDYIMLADGPRPSSYRRIIVSTAGLVTPKTNSNPNPVFYDRQNYLLGYLAKLTRRDTEEIRGLFVPASTIAWLSDRDFRSKVDAKLSQQVFDLRNFIVREQLLGHGHFSGTRLVITPHIVDPYGEPSGLSPMIREKEFVLP